MSFFNKLVKATPLGYAIGGTEGIGSLLNDITGVTAQTKAQKEMMDAQNAYNTKMWNLQNEYNTPAAQLARMAEAGINVNPLSYALGTGNLSNTASSVSSSSGFVGSPAGNPITMLMGVAQGVQGLKNAKADYQLKQTTNDRTELENQIMRHNLKYGQDHNLPVGSVPGMDATFASVVNKALTAGSKSIIDKGNSHGSSLRNWLFGG